VSYFSACLCFLLYSSFSSFHFICFFLVSSSFLIFLYCLSKSVPVYVCMHAFIFFFY
jgi:hypothetical protein